MDKSYPESREPPAEEGGEAEEGANAVNGRFWKNYSAVGKVG